VSVKNRRARKLTRGRTLAAVLASTVVAAGIAAMIGQAAEAAVIHEVVIAAYNGESGSARWGRAWDRCMVADQRSGGTTHSTHYKAVEDPYVEQGMWTERWTCDDSK
jgi:hypothetical protein